MRRMTTNLKKCVKWRGLEKVIRGTGGGGYFVIHEWAFIFLWTVNWLIFFVIRELKRVYFPHKLWKLSYLLNEVGHECYFPLSKIIDLKVNEQNTGKGTISQKRKKNVEIGVGQSVMGNKMFCLWCLMSCDLVVLLCFYFHLVMD